MRIPETKENSVIHPMWGGLAALLVLPSLALAGARIEISDDAYITLGAGLRTSAAFTEAGLDGHSEDHKDFSLESLRIYSGGQIRPGLSVELNTEFQSDGVGEEKIRVLAGVVKLEPSPLFRLWAGRFVPPSDRSNLSGPYYLGSFDFPFVHRYPATFAGHDNGIAYWGELAEGALKWQGGAFEGGNAGSAEDGRGLLWTGRLTLNLWDPESGYYNASTYYGDKDVLALGLVAMRQNDAVRAAQGADRVMSEGDFRAWSVDFLMEKKLVPGVLTLEGAYYDYDRDGLGSIHDEGAGWFALFGWLFPGEVGPRGWLKARAQAQVRYQRFSPDSGVSALNESSVQRVSAGRHERWDMGVSFVFAEHNARVSLIYSRERLDDGGSSLSHRWRDRFKIGLQVQL